MALGIADRIFNITGPDVSDIYVHCPHCGAQATSASPRTRVTG